MWKGLHVPGLTFATAVITTFGHQAGARAARSLSKDFGLPRSRAFRETLVEASQHCDGPNEATAAPESWADCGRESASRQDEQDANLPQEDAPMMKDAVRGDSVSARVKRPLKAATQKCDGNLVIDEGEPPAKTPPVRRTGTRLKPSVQALRRIGGRLLFAEHVGHPKGTGARFLQDVLAPLVKYFTGGCYMNRDSGSLLREAGFADITLDQVDLNIPCEYSYHVYGFATV
ncbi:hypothetical protein HPB50_003274 [Hyalomma asiaticum]|uniref:Uncharacterized protein n=1 Tax=Hyalomma asiaticum TaxID=266040 RepID=A0ACB7S2L3_HYAAI|nr:hypothetical protein HPB50_003274 [Hyalomma asiaticum]